MAEKKKKAETVSTPDVTKDVTSQEDNLIRGETRSGIKFVIDKKIKDETRVAMCLTDMQDKSLDRNEQSQALFSLLRLIFGSRTNVVIFMNEVAAKHNGVADVTSLMEELTDIFTTANLKNS